MALKSDSAQSPKYPEVPDPTALSVSVGIATTGRARILGQTIEYLANLEDHPDRVVISVAAAHDIDANALPPLPFSLEIIDGPKGACHQRNAVLANASDTDLILFLDDDFLIADGYLTAMKQLFARNGDVVMATGKVLADGIHGPGLSHSEGLAILRMKTGKPLSEAAPRDVYSVYGCNMAIRCATLADHPEKFDERLKLYAWLEDMDLSRRMAGFGRVVCDENLRGIHLGTKTGRSEGLLLGYSQIANPVYLVRKGTVARSIAVKQITRNILANLGKSIRPEPWIDRRGRARGNLLALFDLLRRRCAPERILEL
jgi:GT2 family glycosyltransferase